MPEGPVCGQRMSTADHGGGSGPVTISAPGRASDRRHLSASAVAISGSNAEPRGLPSKVTPFILVQAERTSLLRCRSQRVAWVRDLDAARLDPGRPFGWRGGHLALCGKAPGFCHRAGTEPPREICSVRISSPRPETGFEAGSRDAGRSDTAQSRRNAATDCVHPSAPDRVQAGLSAAENMPRGASLQPAVSPPVSQCRMSASKRIAQPRSDAR